MTVGAKAQKPVQIAPLWLTLSMIVSLMGMLIITVPALKAPHPDGNISDIISNSGR